MPPIPPSAATAGPANGFPEPITADEGAWLMETAKRLAPAACAMELGAIATILLAGADAAPPPVEFIAERIASHPAPGFGAAAVPDCDLEAVLASAPAHEDPAEPRVDDSHAPAFTPSLAHAGVPLAPAAQPQDDGAKAAPAAQPLFPRSASQQRRRGNASRQRNPRDTQLSDRDAGLQLALPLAPADRMHVAASLFASRLTTIRAQLAEEERAPTPNPHAEVVSFTARLQRIRASLAAEEA